MLFARQSSFFGVTLGERIAAAREMAGMNQTDLAHAIGVTRAAVQQWESGKTKDLRLANLFSVARVTGADIYWLGNDATPPPHQKVLSKFGRLPSELQRVVIDQIETPSSLSSVTGRPPKNGTLD